MSAYNQTPKHLTRLYRAFFYSLSGLKSTFCHEQAFRLEVYLLPIIVALALWWGKSGIEYGLLIGSWLFVMVIELINSAIEAAIDRIGPERHELSGRAKDIGSAAVLMSILLSFVLWVSILLF